MAATQSKFLFDLDFSPDSGSGARPVTVAELAVKLAEAESKAFADGFAAAERQGTAEAARRAAVAFEQIGDTLSRLARGLAAVELRLEIEAVEVAVAVGRKLAPELVAREPLAEIAALAADCFKQLAPTPHLAVHVNDTQHEAARQRLDEIASACGFAGRLLVMAAPEIAVGDCRIEWSDGGLTRDRAATEAAIAEVVARYIAGCRDAATGIPEVTS